MLLSIKRVLSNLNYSQKRILVKTYKSIYYDHILSFGVMSTYLYTVYKGICWLESKIPNKNRNIVNSIQQNYPI